MITEITAALNGLKAAKDIVQGMHALQSEAAVNAVKIELQGLILDAHQGLFAAQQADTLSAQRIAELERKISDLETWKVEAARYELAEAGQGTLAYRLREGMQDGEPDHWLCPACYGRGSKSFLQPEIRFPGRNHVLTCGTCSVELITSGSREVAPVRRPPPAGGRR
jgi:hypothetical protein